MARAPTRPGCPTSSVRLRGSGSTPPLFQVPQHARINVTIYNYDSGSPLRNQQLGLVTGTYGNVATLDGKRFKVINSNAGNGVGHTFSIPSLGVNVPLYGNNSNANLCGAPPAPRSRRTRSSGSPSPAPAPGLPMAVLRPVRARSSSTATVGRCRRSATWAAS